MGWAKLHPQDLGNFTHQQKDLFIRPYKIDEKYLFSTLTTKICFEMNAALKTKEEKAGPR